MDQKRLKILFLSEFVGEVDRGVESHVLELSKKLKDFAEIDILSGKEAYSLKKVLTKKYDLVIPTNGRMQSLMASFGRILGGYKTLIAGHSGIGRDELWNIFITAPDVFVPLTDYELNWAKKWAWKSRLVKIPNGVDLNKFSPKGEKIKFPLEGKLILSVGALEWYKYHQRTVEAVGELEDCSLLIIGDGPQKDELHKLGNKLLGPKRFQITKIDYSDIAKYYRSAELFVLPSWDREAFGIVYLEAMASGLPIVAPDDPPRREIIGQAGIFVDVSEKIKYASAIKKALEKNWHHIPREQAKKFSWEKIADSYIKLIKEIIK